MNENSLRHKSKDLKEYMPHTVYRSMSPYNRPDLFHFHEGLSNVLPEDEWNALKLSIRANWPNCILKGKIDRLLKEFRLGEVYNGNELIFEAVILGNQLAFRWMADINGLDCIFKGGDYNSFTHSVVLLQGLLSR